MILQTASAQENTLSEVFSNTDENPLIGYKFNKSKKQLEKFQFPGGELKFKEKILIGDKEFYKVQRLSNNEEKVDSETFYISTNSPSLKNLEASEFQKEIVEGFKDLEKWTSNALASFKQADLSNSIDSSTLQEELLEKLDNFILLCDQNSLYRSQGQSRVNLASINNEISNTKDSGMREALTHIAEAFTASSVDPNLGSEKYISYCENKIALAYQSLKKSSSLSALKWNTYDDVKSKIHEIGSDSTQYQNQLDHSIAEQTAHKEGAYAEMLKDGLALDFLNNIGDIVDDSNPLVGASKQQYQRGMDSSADFENWMSRELRNTNSCKGNDDQNQSYTPGVYELQEGKWFYAYSNGKAYKLQNQSKKKLKLFIDNPNNLGTIRVTAYNQDNNKYYNFSVPKGSYVSFYKTFKMCSFYNNPVEPAPKAPVADESQREGSIHTKIVPPAPAPKQAKTPAPVQDPTPTPPNQNGDDVVVSDKTQKLIDIAYNGSKIARSSTRSVTGKKASTKSLGRCSMYTLITMRASGCFDRTVRGDAKDQGPTFLEQGFTNLLKQPNAASTYKTLYDFPPGTVLIYGGGDAGHIEMRTKFGFVSDYFSNTPRTGSSGSKSGRKRYLIGAYVKPSCGAGSL